MAIYRMECHACGHSGMCCSKVKCPECDSSSVSGFEVTDEEAGIGRNSADNNYTIGSNFSSGQDGFTDSYNGTSDY